MAQYHKILERQIGKFLGEHALDTVDDTHEKLFSAISNTYTHADEDRALLERSLDLSTKELTEKASLMKSALDSITEGIVMVNNHGRITTYNDRFTEILKTPPELMLSRDAKKVLDFVAMQVQYPEIFLKKVQETYREPNTESVDLVEFNDGSVIELYSQPQKTSGQEHLGRIWIFRDVTKEKREADREKEHTDEINKMNQMMVGREMRMIELKEEIARLKKGLEEATPPQSMEQKESTVV